jgi:hypothetical protein
VVFDKPYVGHASDDDREVIVDGVVWGLVRLKAVLGVPRPIVCLRLSAYRRACWDEGFDPVELRKVAPYASLGKFTEVTPRLVRDIAAKNPPDREVFVTGQYDATKPRGVKTVEGVLQGHLWYPLGSSDWPVEDRLSDDMPWFGEERAKESAREDRRLIAALFSLLAQPSVATTEEHKLDRAAQRRQARARLEPRSNVTVIYTRKPSRPAGEPGTRLHHDHRWAVSGHWRWQPHGPGRAERRLQWIAPHIKGPEGAPLRPRTVVRAWVR